MTNEFEPIEKDIKDALSKTAKDIEEGYPKHLNDIAERGEKVVADGAEKVDGDVESTLKKAMPSASDQGAKDAEKTASSEKSKIAQLLGGESGSKASGPMLESQKADVDQALKEAGLNPQDRAKIMQGLMSKNSPMGKDAADLIAKGHLKDADGYKTLLTQFKDKNTRPAAMMSLKHADDLHASGHTDLLFEMKEEEGKPHFDIDVGTRLKDEGGQDTGRLDYGYQLKDVNVTNLKSASKKATSQLVDAPAEHKVALMDVKGSQSELTPEVAQSLETRAQQSGVTHHLRFSDGTTRTFPEGASVYPSTDE
jgi:hypothetical protein